MKKTYKVIKDAIKLLERPNGWFKGWFKRTNKDGSMAYCSLGAIDRAISQNKFKFEPVRMKVHEKLCKNTPGMKNIVDFNDDEETKLEDVLTVFRKALRDSR